MDATLLPLGGSTVGLDFERRAATCRRQALPREQQASFEVESAIISGRAKINRAKAKAQAREAARRDQAVVDELLAAQLELENGGPGSV
jgi:hypothetical protein